MENSNIYISDVIMRCLLKWKLVILAIVIGVVGLSVFGVCHQKKAMQVTSDKVAVFNAVVAEAEEGLTDAQKSEVYLALDRYVTYQKNYNSLYDYYFGSVVGQLDATAVDTVVLSYFLDTHYSVVYPEIESVNFLDSIMAYLTNNFVDNELCTNIRQILGEDLKEQYVSQLVSAWRDGNVLFISVKGRNQDECTRIAELAKIRVDVLAEKAKKSIADFDITFLESKYNRAPDISLTDNQLNQAVCMDTYQSVMNSMLSYMSEKQRTLLKTLALNELEKEQEVTAEEGLIEPEEAESVALPVRYIQPNYISVGAFLGFFLVICFTILHTLMGGRLLTQNDIRDAFGISRLGTWNSGKPAHGFDKWIINTFGGDGVQFSPDESRGMAAAGIRLLSEKNGYKNLFITGTANDEAVKEEAQKLTEALSRSGVSAQYGRSILYDPESLESMSDKDAVVLIEKIDVSKNSEIQEEVAVCNRQQVPIMGYIALR